MGSCHHHCWPGPLASCLLFTTPRIPRKYRSCFKKETVSPVWWLVPVTVMKKPGQEKFKFKTRLDYLLRCNSNSNNYWMGRTEAWEPTLWMGSRAKRPPTPCPPPPHYGSLRSYWENWRQPYVNAFRGKKRWQLSDLFLSFYSLLFFSRFSPS